MALRQRPELPNLRTPNAAKPVLKRRVSFSETVNVLEFQKGEIFSLGNQDPEVQPLIREPDAVPVLSDLIAQASSLIAQQQSPVQIEKTSVYPQSPVPSSPLDAANSPKDTTDMSMDVSVMALDTSVNVESTKSIMAQLDNLLADASLQPLQQQKAQQQTQQPEPEDKTLVGIDMSMDISMDVSRNDNETVPVKQKLTFLLAEAELHRASELSPDKEAVQIAPVEEEASGDVSAMSMDFSLDTHALKDLVNDMSTTSATPRARDMSLDTKALKDLVQDMTQDETSQMVTEIDIQTENPAAEIDETHVKETSMSMDMVSFQAPDLTMAETSMAVNGKLERLLEMTGIQQDDAEESPAEEASELENNTVSLASKLDKIVETAEATTPRRPVSSRPEPTSEAKRKEIAKTRLEALIGSPAVEDISALNLEGESLLAMPLLDGSALVDLTDDVSQFAVLQKPEEIEQPVESVPEVQAEVPVEVAPAQDPMEVVEEESPVLPAEPLVTATIAPASPTPQKVPVVAATPRPSASEKTFTPRAYGEFMTPMDIKSMMRGFLVEAKTPDVSRLDTTVEETEVFAKPVQDLEIQWLKEQISRLTDINIELARRNAQAEEEVNSGLVDRIYPIFQNTDAGQIDIDLASLRQACEVEAKGKWYSLKRDAVAELHSRLESTQQQFDSKWRQLKEQQGSVASARNSSAKRQRIDPSEVKVVLEKELQSARIGELQRELQALRRSRPVAIENRNVTITFSSPRSKKRFQIQLALEASYPMTPLQYFVRTDGAVSEEQIHTVVQRVKLGYGYLTRLSEILGKLL